MCCKNWLRNFHPETNWCHTLTVMSYVDQLYFFSSDSSIPKSSHSGTENARWGQLGLVQNTNNQFSSRYTSFMIHSQTELFPLSYNFANMFRSVITRTSWYDMVSVKNWSASVSLLCAIFFFFFDYAFRNLSTPRDYFLNSEEEKYQIFTKKIATCILYPVSHLPTFYKQIIFYWQDIATATPKNKGRVLSQPIWNNRFLTVNKKMVFFPHWYQAGIKQISDLFYSCEGHFLPFNSFCNKLNVKCNFL